MACPRPASFFGFCVASVLCGPLAAQVPDLIAVNFAGAVFAIDSSTGAGSQIGTTGSSGFNAMGRTIGGRGPHMSQSVGSLDHLVQLSETSFTIAVTHHGIGLDIVGLAGRSSTELYAIANGLPDRLYVIDTISQAITLIGPTLKFGIQGLTVRNGVVFGWDTNVGLVQINPITGVATDVNPAVGTGGADIRFLLTRTDGRLIGGRNALFEISPSTGVPTLIGSGGYGDVRGAEERSGTSSPFGSGCAGVGGIVALAPAQVVPPGLIAINKTLVTQSNHHQGGVLCAQVIGFSNGSSAAGPLPLLLDPLLGTSGCRLFVSIDVTQLSITDAQGRAGFSLFLPPPTSGLVFHLQHAAFDPVPGGLSWSGGMTVRVLH